MSETSGRRYWTKDELDMLRDLYPTSTAVAIAKKLGRNTKSVHNAAVQHGLTKNPRVTIDRKFFAAIRRLNRQGLPDTHIAREVGCERHTVSRHRKALGLPSNEKGDVWVELIRQSARRQCERAGVESLADVRVLAFRSFAESRGWPAHLAPREVMILDALDALGPLSRRQITEAIGMQWHGSRRSLKCKGGRGSYLANLMADGLVICMPRAIKGKGRGYSTNLYALAPTTIRETHDESEAVQAADAGRHGELAGPDEGGVLRGGRP